MERDAELFSAVVRGQLGELRCGGLAEGLEEKKESTLGCG